MNNILKKFAIIAGAPIGLMAFAAAPVSAQAVNLMSKEPSVCDLHRALSTDIPAECIKAPPKRVGYRGLTRGITKKSPAAAKKRTYGAAIRINFEFGSAQLTKDAKSTLGVLAVVIKHNKKSGFLVTGHTDAKGSANYNLRLSNKRAEAVTTFLEKEYDIQDVRLNWIGKGESSLYDKSKPGSSINRRVEITNIGK
ncbi:MAG: OmpA family protein [Alphaproteobacteria bacterium]|nr:OmpA family protein [Alphaproteobacteria bacterium]